MEFERVTWYYGRGLGDALMNLINLCYVSLDENLPLFLSPQHCEFQDDYVAVEPRGTDILTDYIQVNIPHEIFYLEDVIDISQELSIPLDLGVNEISNMIGNYHIPDVYDLSVISMTDKFKEFDAEYESLCEQYDLANRVAIHVRTLNDSAVLAAEDNISLFFYNLMINGSDTKYYVATDNINIFEKYLRPKIKEYDIFLLPNLERDNVYSIEFAGQPGDSKEPGYVEAFRKNKTEAIKEAYFLSKAPVFFESGSFYSKFVTVLRRLQGK